MEIKLEASWLQILKWEFEKEYMKNIKNFLLKEIKNKKIIYPNPKNFFKAFEKTPFDKVKVVILGQDPYHWPNQAQGFCFSVSDWQKLPPSLKNIYKEIETSLNIKMWDSGDLTKWSEQWILLLNSILTVEWWKPASHSKIWWENFTDEVIKQISEKKENVVFLLWWAFAHRQEKAFCIKNNSSLPIFCSQRFFMK